MDMRRILQAVNGVASKPVEGGESMKKFMTIVEGKGASNRLTTAESMVIEQPTIVTRKEVTSPVLNVAKDAKPSMIGKYFKTIEQEIKEAEDRTRDRTKQLAERVANKINNQRIAELSTDTLGKYKKAAAADAKKADANGDYARGDKRFKGINKATSKQFDNDLKKHGQQNVSEAEGTPSGVAHLTKELLTHIVQQSGKEGAHAVVKSLEWGDGAAKELLHLIINDLKDDIAGMHEDMGGEGSTVKNSLHTIIRVATHLNRAVSDSEEFPEWVSEKIGSIKDQMVSVMDYEISSDELQNMDEAVNPAQQAAIAIAKKKAGKK